MKQKRVALYLFGVAMLVGLAIVAIGTRPTAARTFSPAALSIISGPDAHAQVSPFDLKCNIRVPGGLAQCGSQASSCKNCHEIKGEDPVNAKGDWHTQHTFSDFCEFCHGGNVQATDKAAAHQGLVTPLGDVKANCSSCHADNYQPYAEKYASALGVKVGSGSGGAQPPSQPPSAQQPASQPPAQQPPAQTALQTAPKPAPAAPSKSSDEIVDYTQPGDGISAGNLIVGALLVITVIGGGVFVYWNEKRLRRLAVPKSTEGYVTFETGSVTAPSGEMIAAEPTGEMSPELAKLLPVLRSLDPRTLRALRIILSDRRRGEELLQSLSLINFSVLEEMKRLDKRELSLLLALAGES
jgi:hypothetical protein